MARPTRLVLPRRRLMQAAAGFVAGSVVPARAAPVPELRGTRFGLTVGTTAVNFTGRNVTAVTVNETVPGPVLRWREGDTVTLDVTNRLREPTSIHWHGIRCPANMDGVPGLSFPGIAPGTTFSYRFELHQSGTYWYHSHSGFQEQTGMYGAIVVEPRDGWAEKFDRDHVVMLTDWTDEDPETIVSNLKMQSDYYNHNQRTVGTFFRDVGRDGLGATVSDRLAWGGMRMSPTDIADVTGSTYTYLLNGQPPGGNWTGLFRPGERVRLRFINASSMTLFDVRVPGLALSVVEADGNDVLPVVVDEFRIGPAETYDVIVRPTQPAYTIFAQSEDRTGFARGTLAVRPGLSAPVPPMDARPLRTMADMGMDHGAMGHGTMSPGTMGQGGAAKSGQPAMAGMDHSAMGHGAAAPGPDAPSPARMDGWVGVDNVAMMPAERLNDPGAGLSGNGRRVLTYADLRARLPGADPRPPSREIVLHLTGNMTRYIWGFDGKKSSQAEPIRLKLNERVRFRLINDTMMEHPIHLHGLWSELENGQDAQRPYKHTIIAKPGETLSYLVTADEPGRWAFHCHLLYHMELGMFRQVIVA